MNAEERGFIPPTPQGEPFRADPSDSAPFSSEGQLDAPSAEPWSSAAPVGHPPSHSPEYQRPVPGSDEEVGPQFRKPSAGARPAPPMSHERRFATIALWLGVASIFVLNFFLGPAAIVMGALSIRRGEKELGKLAVIFGAIGTLIGILVAVLVAAGVLPTFDELIQELKKAN